MSYIRFCSTEEDQIHNRATLHVACPTIPDKTMPADALATLGTRASAGMVLTSKVGIIFHLQHQKS